MHKIKQEKTLINLACAKHFWKLRKPYRRLVLTHLLKLYILFFSNHNAWTRKHFYTACAELVLNSSILDGFFANILLKCKIRGPGDYLLRKCTWLPELFLAKAKYFHIIYHHAVKVCHVSMPHEKACKPVKNV